MTNINKSVYINYSKKTILTVDITFLSDDNNRDKCDNDGDCSFVRITAIAIIPILFCICILFIMVSIMYKQNRKYNINLQCLITNIDKYFIQMQTNIILQL